MIDFEKFGFIIEHDNEFEGATRYFKDNLELQYLKKNDCFALFIPPQYLPADFKVNYEYGFPLYMGKIKDETFFEILLASVITDTEKIRMMGS